MRIKDWSSDMCSSDLKLGGGDDRANGAHAMQRPQALINQCPGKGDGIFSVRIPVAIQGGEARRGQGFVDGCPAFYPGIAFRGASGEGRKFGREVRKIGRAS